MFVSCTAICAAKHPQSCFAVMRNESCFRSSNKVRTGTRAKILAGSNNRLEPNSSFRVIPQATKMVHIANHKAVNPMPH